MKQDRNGVRTAQDLERKYNLSDLVGIKKAVKQTEEGINKTNAELENFMKATMGDIENIQNQIDGQIHTHYYSGVPTLSNPPANEWLEEEYTKHLGDLYYDKDTGKAYRFVLDGEYTTYKWIEEANGDVTEALALANAAQDTADSKRRVFVATPYPPYDNGDLWFNNQEIYICQISKAENETYANNDFIIATKYTDDTLATQVGDNLEVVRGQVLTVTEGVDAFKIDIESQVKTINDLQEETIQSMERMSYTFGTKDLTIANSNDPVNARINNQGLKVYTYNTLNSIFNHKGTGVNKLIVVGDTQLENISIVKAIDENGDACTDINHLVSNIQTLADLESDT